MNDAQVNKQALTLGQIFASREAWQRLGQLRMPAHTAYRLLKYAKRVTSELEVIEQQRVKLIRQAAECEQGDVELKPGTEQHAQFVQQFGELLDTTSDLKPHELTLSSLLDLVGKEASNALSVADLGALEPFFAE